MRLSSRAKRVPQGEKGTAVYLIDSQGRYNPAPESVTVPFDTLLQPGESVTAIRRFEVPGDSRDLGLVYTHEGGFPIEFFIIGENRWFHGPPVVRLDEIRVVSRATYRINNVGRKTMYGWSRAQSGLRWADDSPSAWHFSGLMAAALGGGLLPGVNLGWEHFVHHPLWKPAQGPLANAVAALVLIPAFWLLTKPFSRSATRRLLGKTPEAKGNRLSIYVAHFGDNEISATARERVIASIRSELGPDRVELLPAGIQLNLTPGVSDDSAWDDARSKARLLLKKKHGDLLIWGKVYALPEMRPRIELRFVSAENDRSRAEPFGFTDKMMLEADFGVEMGAALAAVASALAAPAVRDAGKYTARTLAPIAIRLAPLTRNIPASMRGDDRAYLFFSYALIKSVIGEQSGQSVDLEEAVAAYRDALKEWTRERVPLDWAMAQNNLGNALLCLGERESGTEKLEEAVAAYREALNVWTRERVPLNWAMTQNNLGSALLSLGERESGTEKLEEAIAAFREALKEGTRERVPLAWATTQNNLGSALSSLGERESGTEKLEEAVAAYREALKERTRERVPLDWAMTQNNLGSALSSLG
ncbi:MAG: tetratricopeptide repeat protein, partial [Bryobacteraceae bacterium]